MAESGRIQVRGEEKWPAFLTSCCSLPPISSLAYHIPRYLAEIQVTARTLVSLAKSGPQSLGQTSQTESTVQWFHASEARHFDFTNTNT